MPVGEADLFLDEIDAGDHFRDRVLDLDARVHFHEKEVVVLVEQEFHRADVPIMRRLSRLRRPRGRFPAASFSSIAGDGVSSTSF